MKRKNDCIPYDQPVYHYRPARQELPGASPFITHLQQQVGKSITVVTSSDKLLGTLAAVYSDHIALRRDSTIYHIPLFSIVYFY